jgi:hypothetical protein
MSSLTKKPRYVVHRGSTIKAHKLHSIDIHAQNLAHPSHILFHPEECDLKTRLLFVINHGQTLLHFYTGSLSTYDK